MGCSEALLYKVWILFKLAVLVLNVASSLSLLYTLMVVIVCFQTEGFP